MIRLFLSVALAAVALASCGPLEGGDPLDGPPGTDGGTLYLRDTPDSSGMGGSAGVDGRYDRY